MTEKIIEMKTKKIILIICLLIIFLLSNFSLAQEITEYNLTNVKNVIVMVLTSNIQNI